MIIDHLLSLLCRLLFILWKVARSEVTWLNGIQLICFLVEGSNEFDHHMLVHKQLDSIVSLDINRGPSYPFEAFREANERKSMMIIVKSKETMSDFSEVNSASKRLWQYFKGSPWKVMESLLSHCVRFRIWWHGLNLCHSEFLSLPDFMIEVLLGHLTL